MKRKCPICGKEMEEWRDVLDGWCLMEEYFGCPDKCYVNYYYTGVTEVTVGNKTLIWNHRTPFERVERIQKIIDRLIDRIKETK